MSLKFEVFGNQKLFKCFIFTLEEQRTKCNNPGNSVPSPFDNCNTCRCSDDGFIDGCTEKFCVDGMLVLDWYSNIYICYISNIPH